MRGDFAPIGRTADEQPFTQDAAEKSKRRSRAPHPPMSFQEGRLDGRARLLFRSGLHWIDAGLYSMEVEDADTAPPRVRLLPKIGRGWEMGIDTDARGTTEG
ncbi:MAG TPA: hypothetical protein VFY65_07150 [Longimicrobium sp.]|nr:hypothetical protein [Longimicrobium sp.]